jgi:hypothetical protein
VFSSAETASEDFIRESIEYPTILPEYTSFTGTRMPDHLRGYSVGRDQVRIDPVPSVTGLVFHR